MNTIPVWVYILVMALVTYLIRAVPFVLFRKRIQSRFIRSLLYYMPYAVLSAMTIPSIFSSTGSVISACAGFAVAAVLALCKRSLITVAIAACAAAYLSDLIAGLL